jgi:hypothetical protein
MPPLWYFGAETHSKPKFVGKFVGEFAHAFAYLAVRSPAADSVDRSLTNRGSQLAPFQSDWPALLSGDGQKSLLLLLLSSSSSISSPLNLNLY